MAKFKVRRKKKGDSKWEDVETTDITKEEFKGQGKWLNRKKKPPTKKELGDLGVNKESMGEMKRLAHLHHLTNKSKKKPLTDKEKAMVGQHMEYQSEKIGGSLLRRKKNRIKRKKHMGMQSKLRKKEPMPVTDNR